MYSLLLLMSSLTSFSCLSVTGALRMMRVCLTTMGTLIHVALVRLFASCTLRINRTIQRGRGGGHGLSEVEWVKDIFIWDEIHSSSCVVQYYTAIVFDHLQNIGAIAYTQQHWVTNVIFHENMQGLDKIRRSTLRVIHRYRWKLIFMSLYTSRSK